MLTRQNWFLLCSLNLLTSVYHNNKMTITCLQNIYPFYENSYEEFL